MQLMCRNAKIYQEWRCISNSLFTEIYSRLRSGSFNAYRILRTTNPSQYMVLMKNDDVEIAGSSPETLVKVNGHEITTMPIAGTRPRGATEELDQALEKELWLMPKK